MRQAQNENESELRSRLDTKDGINSQFNVLRRKGSANKEKGKTSLKEKNTLAQSQSQGGRNNYPVKESKTNVQRNAVHTPTKNKIMPTFKSTSDEASILQNRRLSLLPSTHPLREPPADTTRKQTPKRSLKKSVQNSPITEEHKQACIKRLAHIAKKHGVQNVPNNDTTSSRLQHNQKLNRRSSSNTNNMKNKYPDSDRAGQPSPHTIKASRTKEITKIKTTSPKSVADDIQEDRQSFKDKTIHFATVWKASLDKMLSCADLNVYYDAKADLRRDFCFCDEGESLSEDDFNNLINKKIYEKYIDKKRRQALKKKVDIDEEGTYSGQVLTVEVKDPTENIMSTYQNEEAYCDSRPIERQTSVGTGYDSLDQILDKFEKSPELYNRPTISISNELKTIDDVPSDESSYSGLSTNSIAELDEEGNENVAGHGGFVKCGIANTNPNRMKKNVTIDELLLNIESDYRHSLDDRQNHDGRKFDDENW